MKVRNFGKLLALVGLATLMASVAHAACEPKGSMKVGSGQHEVFLNTENNRLYLDASCSDELAKLEGDTIIHKKAHGVGTGESGTCAMINGSVVKQFYGQALGQDLSRKNTKAVIKGN